mmetsp:Transcript_66368/g.190815  ORF Transcript_66368/g.190815 Transcript_66368/m.190815 type:complete len:293 (-) Transcript_66368:938-1816(-)
MRRGSSDDSGFPPSMGRWHSGSLMKVSSNTAHARWMGLSFTTRHMCRLVLFVHVNHWSSGTSERCCMKSHCCPSQTSKAKPSCGRPLLPPPPAPPAALLPFAESDRAWRKRRHLTSKGWSKARPAQSEPGPPQPPEKHKVSQAVTEEPSLKRRAIEGLEPGVIGTTWSMRSRQAGSLYNSSSFMDHEVKFSRASTRHCVRGAHVGKGRSSVCRKTMPTRAPWAGGTSSTSPAYSILLAQRSSETLAPSEVTFGSLTSGHGVSQPWAEVSEGLEDVWETTYTRMGLPPGSRNL